MKRILISAVLALFAFLPSGAANESSANSLAPAASTSQLDHDESGEARGTVVVWEHYRSGKPTAHLRGTLRDGYGNRFAEVVARLEDHGGVTGYALTRYGYYQLRGHWKFDRHDERGQFDIRFDYGDSREAILEGSFQGWRDRWNGEWELGYR